jgi:hypothetical protein
VPGLGRRELPVDDRPAHVHAPRVAVQLGIQTRRPIASGVRRPVDASNSNSGRHRSGISASSRASCRLVRKRRSSNSYAPAPAAGQHHPGARVAADKAGAVCVAQAGAQRHHGVVDRAVAQSVPVGSMPATKPVDEAAHTLFVEVAQTLFGGEVRKRVGDEQTPVLAAGAIVDDVMTAATGVVIDPLQRVAVERRPGPARGLLRRGANLDLTRRAKRGRRSPALAAVLEGRRRPTASRARRRRASRCAEAPPPSTRRPPLSPCGVRRDDDRPCDRPPPRAIGRVSCSAPERIRTSDLRFRRPQARTQYMALESQI